ncbi:MAG: amino acid ABC transporter permease [Actinobacteria bacterium]|nr:amino acid ABC transporter permease [Actinomycetota bacterium]MBW3649440.1 amino acid ABC transporter permease [Actinomycetota bacterium]
MRIVFDNLGLYAQGMRTTVVLTLTSFAAAMVVGTVVAAFRVSPVPPLRAAGAVWVQMLRNTPLTVLLLLFVFGFTKIGLQYSFEVSSVIVFGAYTSAFVAETVRSGINAVARGQAEAARAVGLTFPQILGIVVLPQAFRTVVAPLGNIFIALTKNTSIAAIISVLELTEVADRLNNATARPIPVFLGAAVAYLVLTLPSGFAFGWLERKVAIRR